MESQNTLPTPYQNFIYKSRYARWRDDVGRRENWPETVDRWVSFWEGRFPGVFPKEEVREMILRLGVMPSMRGIMTAGAALDRDEVAGYNCSYVPIDHPRAFDEVLYILACGTGVGFSVERQNIAKLPVVNEELHDSDTVIVVKDSKIGWASAFRELISLLYSGQVPKWDVSKVRPAGARLKTFGGRASGPAPLVDLFNYTVGVFKDAAGRKLTSLECHDLVCKIGSVIVSGGVRRSALISLSNLSDDRMRSAKIGQFPPHRFLANNSAVYTERPEMTIFLKEWLSLIESKAGERGIFSRSSAVAQAKRTGRRNWEGQEYGTNPCGEIILRPNGFCNLSEVVVRPEDTLEDLEKKVRIATVIGTFQSTLTNFRYLRPIWRKNAEEERLLGVSMTGIMDHPVLSGQYDKEHGLEFVEGEDCADRSRLAKYLTRLKEVAVETNKEWAEKLGIPVSAAITTVKPSGTVSQLVNSASGIHPRYAQYYIRAVRNDKKDPITKFLRSQNFPMETDAFNDATDVISFPMRSPDPVGDHEVLDRNSFSAMEQLEHYLRFKELWCEHNPSITVYVKDSEWLEVGNWVYQNFHRIGGISFLPHSNHVYRQAPYTEVTKEEYEKAVSELPELDWARMEAFELEDMTTGSQELACVGGQCEVNF